jgi:hypothetical protein
MRRHDHDPRRGAGDQPLPQEVGEQEVPEVVDAEHLLEALGGLRRVSTMSPALFTSTSRRSKRSRNQAANERIEANDARSRLPSSTVLLPERATTSARASSPLAWLRAVMTTVAPIAASATAVSLPMPELAPVTMTT